jgi:hypothetical protein
VLSIVRNGIALLVYFAQAFPAHHTLTILGGEVACLHLLLSPQGHVASLPPEFTPALRTPPPLASLEQVERDAPAGRRKRHEKKYLRSSVSKKSQRAEDEIMKPAIDDRRF